MSLELSAAIIFKNEIRCLERCLKSLQPLRERFSFEIVMADTGSTDGSRDIAERYADIVFDFPWINDFSAARNAVLDRCSGEWALVLDCDEWLDPDLTELEHFLHGEGARACNSALLKIRNYLLAGSTGRFTDALIARLLRMADHPRYGGAIHEYPSFPGIKTVWTDLSRTILHHDGYIMLNDGSEAGRGKKKRNIELIRAELEKDPENVSRISQFLDVGVDEPDFIQVLRRAVELSRTRETKVWRCVGPQILSNACYIAHNTGMREEEEWIEAAMTRFPDSYFTLLDVAFLRMMRAYKAEDFEQVAELGQEYMRGLSRADGDPEGISQTIRYGTLQRYNPYYRQFARLRLMEAYQHLGRFEEIPPLLEKTDWSILENTGTRDLLWLWMQLFISSHVELSEMMVAFWRGIGEETPDRAAAEARKQTFLQNAEMIFAAKPDNSEGREPWQMFLPLRGECVIGDAAALMNTNSPYDAERILAQIEDLTKLPGRALAHTLETGAEFPDRVLTMELADTLAFRMKGEAELLRSIAVLSARAAQSDQDVLWARALVLAAVQQNNWEKDEQPLELIYAFAYVESAFLGRCYTRGALKNDLFLPPMHRFALHICNALHVIAPTAVAAEFTPTAGGDVHLALSELKEAVKASPEQKKIVDLILDDFKSRL